MAKKHQFGKNVIMTIAGQALGEHICQLFRQRDIGKTDIFTDKVLTNKVTVNFNVLSALMKNSIL